MHPVNSPRSLPGDNCRTISYCPHVQKPEGAKMVGCDDQGFGPINWWLTCDSPVCVGEANKALAGCFIDWNNPKSTQGGDEVFDKMAARYTS